MFINEENSHWFWALGIAAMATVAGVGYYYAWHMSNSPPPVARSSTPDDAPVPDQKGPGADEPKPIQHPIEEAPAAAQPNAKPAASASAAPATPAERDAVLRDSDSQLRKSLNENNGTRRLANVLNPSGMIIRRFVATVDNLSRSKVATQVLPVQTLGSRFVVAGKGDSLAIAPDNARRYEPYVQIAESIDTKTLAAIYVRHYGLFQEAYRELGYPKGYFNDRLVDTIDHLLKAPDVKGPIQVKQPKVLYEYVDQELESLSAGQKVMVRMGPDNAAKVKARLREFRGEITRHPPRGG
jgi:Protein of unknown function (DUF3014)